MKFALSEGLQHFHEIAEKEVENAEQGINHCSLKTLKNKLSHQSQVGIAQLVKRFPAAR